MEKVDWVIIGAGVIGAAVAERLSRAHRKASILVLEREAGLARGITSRNSGVIHSGIYYPKGSLKATLCIRGQQLLYEWCEKHRVPFAKCGKVIVATDADEVAPLETLFRAANDCGAPGLEMISPTRLTGLEPAASGHAAIWAPQTGIVDSEGLAKSLLTKAEDQGDVQTLLHTNVTGIERKGDGYRLTTSRGEIETAGLINASGLYADEIAALVGVTKYKIYPYRGDYFSLSSKYSFTRLVYPMKKPGAAGLGVHVTMDLGGRCRLGPDVELAQSKEDFSPRPEKRSAFFAAARKFLPGLREEDLSYEMVGLRPKLRAPGEANEKDFVIAIDGPGFVNLVGIESPGLTASLAIGEKVLELF